MDLTSFVVGSVLPVGDNPKDVIFTADGSTAWVANESPGSVSRIDVASRSVAATFPTDAGPFSLTLIEQSDQLVVVAPLSAKTQLLDASTGAVLADIPTSGVYNDLVLPSHIRLVAGGKLALISAPLAAVVYVIDTDPASAGYGTIQDSLPMPSFPAHIVLSPDASLAYVLSVIGNTVTILSLPPSSVAFAALTAKVKIELEGGGDDEWKVGGTFALGESSDGIDPLAEDVTIQLGPFSITIPAGSFEQKGEGPFTFKGDVAGVELKVEIKPKEGRVFKFKAEGEEADLTGVVNPVEFTLGIGDDTGTISVTAKIDD